MGAWNNGNLGRFTPRFGVALLATPSPSLRSYIILSKVESYRSKRLIEAQVGALKGANIPIFGEELSPASPNTTTALLLYFSLSKVGS